ncbi:MAG: hypothetical protein R3D67_15395 [Hyphomicrobiaceae bacterium]
MKPMKQIALGLAAATLAVSPALALTINNRDSARHTVQFSKGNRTAERSLAAGELLEEACVKGCVVRLAGSDAKFNAKDSDALIVKGGKIEKAAGK